MNKLKMHTPNKANQNFKKLAEMFPNAVTETVGEDGRVVRAIDKDVLMQEIGSAVVEGNDERYQFTWPGKKRAVRLANAPVSKTLRPCREDSVDFDSTENLYIEGDNLDALKLLQETYSGMVKMIYIDPPYNTGKDFVYNDNFAVSNAEFGMRNPETDENGDRIVHGNDKSGRFHTDWLNMMYPRLKLARELLADDGVILINIDENEVTNMQKICLEIYGEQNDLGTMIWDKRNPKGDARGISYQHEYILVYTKSKPDFLKSGKVRRPKKNARAILKKAAQLYAELSEKYTLDDVNRDFSAWMRNQKDFSGGERAYNKIDENGDVYRPVSMAWPNKKKAPDDYFIPLIHPVTKKPCPVPARGWRNPPAKMKKMLESGRIIFGKDETTIPNSKYLLKENMYENIPSLLYYGGSDVAMLKEMSIPFDTPKAVSICKEHIQSFTGSGDIVLDFFSGSATTAHAVMLSNAEDGGKRRFIMVQLPEPCNEKSEAFKAGYKNISEIGKERIRCAANKIRKENPNAEFDGGFRVLKIDSTNLKDAYCERGENDDIGTSGGVKNGRTGEDMLFQVMLDLGIALSEKIEESVIGGVKVFTVGEGGLIACFDDGVTEETLAGIAKQKPRYFVTSGSAEDADRIFETYSSDTIIKIL